MWTYASSGLDEDKRKFFKHIVESEIGEKTDLMGTMYFWNLHRKGWSSLKVPCDSHGFVALNPYETRRCIGLSSVRDDVGIFESPLYGDHYYENTDMGGPVNFMEELRAL